jgi:hypothetical protein
MREMSNLRWQTDQVRGTRLVGVGRWLFGEVEFVHLGGIPKDAIMNTVDGIVTVM